MTPNVMSLSPRGLDWRYMRPIQSVEAVASDNLTDKRKILYPITLNGIMSHSYTRAAYPAIVVYRVEQKKGS